MLTIRFNRTGKRNRAQFRVVVQEHIVAPGGRHIEVLGSYDPHQKKAELKAERIKYWMEKGAQVSDSVWNLLIKNNVISGVKRPIKIKKKVDETETAGAKKENKETKGEEKGEREKEVKGKGEKAEQKEGEDNKNEKEDKPKEEMKDESKG